jgi:aspartyl-tRNA synthetase
MAIKSGLKKVAEVCTIFRAEKSNKHRHLCKYVGLRMEMESKDRYFEVIKKKVVFICNSSSDSCKVLDALFVELFNHLAEKYTEELEIINKQFPFEPLKVCATILMFLTIVCHLNRSLSLWWVKSMFS